MQWPRAAVGPLRAATDISQTPIFARFAGAAPLVAPTLAIVSRVRAALRSVRRKAFAIIAIIVPIVASVGRVTIVVKFTRKFVAIVIIVLIAVVVVRGIERSLNEVVHPLPHRHCLEDAVAGYGLCIVQPMEEA